MANQQAALGQTLSPMAGPAIDAGRTLLRRLQAGEDLSSRLRRLLLSARHRTGVVAAAVRRDGEV